MVSEEVTARIRKFVCDELRGEEDLRTLTLGILKKRYLALVGEDWLSPDARNFMKQVVEEELMKMQDNDEDEDEVENKKPQNKRKRREENNEDQSGDEDESTSKKPRHQLRSSSSESEDNEGHKSGSEDEKEEEEEEVKSGSEDSEDQVENPHRETNRINLKGQKKSEDSPDEDESGESESDNPKEEGMKHEKDDEGEDGEKINKDESSGDSENEEKVPLKTGNDSDSDSSSLPSLEDEQETATKKKDEKKKKKGKDDKKDDTKKKEDHGKDADKQVARLKHYIYLCGVMRNYKKLLEGCRSTRAMVAALKKELEDLGVEGRPTIKKCKRVKKKREEAQEIAELDVNNIITTQGRPKRRGASLRHDEHDPPSSTYKRALNSGSDSDEENKRPRRTTDWSNLQGIISDGADSD